MSKRTRPVKITAIEVNPLKGKRKGACLKEQIWFEDGKVVAYSLAYINLKRCRVDHGRVLGYDNSMASTIGISWARSRPSISRHMPPI